MVIKLEKGGQYLVSCRDKFSFTGHSIRKMIVFEITLTCYFVQFDNEDFRRYILQTNVGEDYHIDEENILGSSRSYINFEYNVVETIKV